ncbi:LacI family transcriptional regulator [Tepidamorphus gemmatus]|jgi:LacI family transcriptional regulator|uniref:LacI family transcriptional regulator n=1 Tax=Tepidamorphus gemmatus TaxID=747076 RepID=A0A4V6NZR8_9HYPH|nr:LacI family DNA-binding transcriptional regulator [Tepidamorphus gemmatus]TCT12493.1 LacI family transcriptional regulator [Tepidamorphus gemmatus]
MKERAKRERSRVGLREVAAIAGVSTATVSRVINRPESVSDDLRRRVTMVIDQLGWVPNAAARALSSQRTGAIGAIFPALALGDFARAIDAMQDALAERNFLLLLARSRYDADLEYRLVRKLAERGVDGLILVGSTRSHDYEDFLSKLEIPYVNSFVYHEGSEVPCVGPDNRAAMAEMADYLVSLGHRRFGMIAQTTRNNDRAAARRDGVQEALARYGIAIPPSAMREGEWSIGEGRRLFRQILDSPLRPTAVICGNSLLAIGAVLEATALGIRIPDEMSIVGYDDIEPMSELPVPITTVRVASDEVGRVAANTIVDMVEGVPGVVSRRIPSEIVVRASSGPAPSEQPLSSAARTGALT